MSSEDTQRKIQELNLKAMEAQAKGAVLIRTPKPKKLGPEGLSIGKAEGCDNCKFSVPQGLTTSSVKLTREEPAISAADCNKIKEDEQKVRAGTLSFNQLKEDLYRGKYYKATNDGKCGVIWVPRGRLNYATNVDGGTTLEFWARGFFGKFFRGLVDGTRYPNIINNAPVYNRQTMLEYGGFSIETKLVLTPSLPFNLTFQSGRMPLPIQINVERMTLFRPCPVRVDNVQYDAVLTLNDPASDPRTPCVVMIPIAAGIGDSNGDVFFRKIAEVIPAMVQPDPKTGTYNTIDVQTGSTWDISKLIPGKAEGGRTIANVGYYVWSAAPRMEEVIGEVNEKFVKTTWIPTDDKGPVYIMLKDPIKVSSSTLATIQMLPATPIDKAIHDPLEGSITYSKGPPGSDVKGCSTQKNWSPKFISKETFELSEESCDPFANLPKKESVNPGVIIGYILAVLSALALAIGIIYAIKLVVTEKGDTIMHLGKKLGKSLAGLQNQKPGGPPPPAAQQKAPSSPPAQQKAPVVPRVPPARKTTSRGLDLYRKGETRRQPRGYQARQIQEAKKALDQQKQKEEEEESKKLLRDIEAAAKIQEEKIKLQKLPKLPTDAELYNDKKMIAKRKQLEDLYRKIGEAKSSLDAAKMLNAPTVVQEERNYNIAKARYADAKTIFMKEVDEHTKYMKEKQEDSEKINAMKVEAQKVKQQLEEETKATEELAKKLQESHEQQTKQAEEVTDKIAQVRGLKRQNAAPNVIASAAASLKKEKEELEKKQKESEEVQERVREIKKDVQTGKKEFDTGLIGKAFRAQQEGKTAIQQAQDAVKLVNETLQQSAKTEQDTKKTIQEADEAYRQSTAAGTGLAPTATTPKSITKAPPLAQTKKREGKRNIKSSERKLEIRPDNKKPLTKELTFTPKNVTRKMTSEEPPSPNRLLNNISDVETDINDVLKRIDKNKVDFNKSGKSVPIAKLSELRKLENQANKGVTQLVSNANALKEEYEKKRDEIQEQHRMEGTTVTAREIADARKKVLEAGKIEKSAEEVKAKVESAMSEEDKEKAARDYAAAQAKLRYTNRAINNLGLPSLQVRRIGRGRRRNHTRRY